VIGELSPYLEQTAVYEGSRAADEGKDGIEIDRLDQVVVKPRFLRTVSCLLFSVTGDGNEY